MYATSYAYMYMFDVSLSFVNI